MPFAFVMRTAFITPSLPGRLVTFAKPKSSVDFCAFCDYPSAVVVDVRSVFDYACDFGFFCLAAFRVSY